MTLMLMMLMMLLIVMGILSGGSGYDGEDCGGSIDNNCEHDDVMRQAGGTRTGSIANISNLTGIFVQVWAFRFFLISTMILSKPKTGAWAEALQP